MAFNYEKERRKFERQWAHTRKEYEAAGMDESSIHEMYEFDYRCFKKTRIIAIHETFFPNIDYNGELSEYDRVTSMVDNYYESFSNVDTYGKTTRYGWIDEIDNQRIVTALRTLPPSDLELLTQYVFDELTQSEIAKITGVSQKSISKRLARIKKVLSTGV